MWESLRLGASGSVSTKDKWDVGARLAVGARFAQRFHDMSSYVSGSDGAS
jgi:hypothetical protein